MTPLDLTSVDHLLSTTRAVRHRLDLTRPVPRSVVHECLRLAIQAPSGSNVQSWRWVVVTDPGKRAALADLYREGATRGRAVLQANGTLPTSDPTPAEQRMLDSTDHLATHLQHVPVLVVPCVTASAGNIVGWAPSIYPAVWSLMLALRSRGLGSCLTTQHLWCASEAAALLGIPDTMAQAALLPVAWFTGDDFRPASRVPAEEVTYWDAWGALDPHGAEDV